jgi:hypothetical protein
MAWTPFKNERRENPEVLNMNVKGKMFKRETRIKMGTTR